MLSKNYLQLTNETVRDQFLTPMGMMCAPIVKHESIVEWQDLPILKGFVKPTRHLGKAEDQNDHEHDVIFLYIDMCLIM